MTHPNAETQSGRGKGFRGTEQSTHHKCESDPQQLGILTRKIALAGHTVHKGQNQDFIVTRWGMSRYCADLPSLQAFARQLGVSL